MNIKNLTIEQLHKKYLNGEVTVEEVTRNVLKAVETNSYNAYISSCENAIEHAKKIDELGVKSILDGIPCAIKDNINYTGHLTTCASKALSNYVSIYNATVTQKLLDANSIICAKTNLDEFAMGSSGITSFYGDTLNPDNPKHSPGGSSSGSAAAVAAGDVLFALGSDTGGSVRQPAAFCGVVGFRPTYGMISRFGVVSLNASLDQVGIITKNVYDNALVFDYLQGKDEKDATSLDVKVNAVDNLEIDIKGKKIFIDTSAFDFTSKSIVNALKNTAEQLSDKGAIIEYGEMKYIKHAPYVYLGIVSSEVTSNLAQFDGIRYGHRTESYESLQDVYSKTRTEGFGLEVKRRILIGADILKQKNYNYFKELLQFRRVIANEFEEVFQNYDFILSQMTVRTAPELEVAKRSYFGQSVYEESTALAGLPSISIPVGREKSSGLSIGLQIIANKKEDAKVFSLAKYIEDHCEEGEY